VLQRVAVCCSVLQCIAVLGGLNKVRSLELLLEVVSVCCSVLQCVAVYCIAEWLE